MTTDNTTDPGKDRRTPEMLELEIKKLAKAGDFTQAEKLRRLLLANHPMALSAIIASGETIETEKSLAIDKNHLAIWENLYGRLSREEQNCLFYATKSAKVASNKMIIRQGKSVPRLLFIDNGRVTLFHTKGNDRILLGQLSRGDVLGEETFFHLSTPTFSAGAQTDVHLRYLDKDATREWEEHYPGLYQKIGDYCYQHSRASQLQQQKNIEKRLFPRMKADCKLIAYVLGEDGGRSGDSFRGSLLDLSRSGTCFEIHCPRAESAQALLGRIIDIELEPEGHASGRMILQGIIVKVGALMHNDFTIHVSLHSELSQMEMVKHLVDK